MSTAWSKSRLGSIRHGPLNSGVMGNERTVRRRAVSDDQKLERRQAITDAAKRVFSEKGFHETTIAAVAADAGMSYGTIYWYFDSKEDLFHAVIEAEEAALGRRYAGPLRATSLTIRSRRSNRRSL